MIDISDPCILYDGEWETGFSKLQSTMDGSVQGEAVATTHWTVTKGSQASLVFNGEMPLHFIRLV